MSVESQMLKSSAAAATNLKAPRRFHTNRQHPKDFSRALENRKSSLSSKRRPAGLAANMTPLPVPAANIQPVPTLAPPRGTTLTVLPPISSALYSAEAAMSSAAMTSMMKGTNQPVMGVSTLLLTSSSVMFPTLLIPTSIISASSSLHSSLVSSSSSLTAAASTLTRNAQASSSIQSFFHHFSTATIVLLAVGSSLFFFGVFVIFKCALRPSKNAHPIPSNPIPLDEYISEKYEDIESPIFGGKERVSAAASVHTSGLWPWTQYQSGIPKAPAPAMTKPVINISGPTDRVPIDRVQFTPQKDLLQPVQHAAPRVASRLSTASVSLYPNSPRDPHSVGLAIDDSLYHLEGLSVLKSNPKTRNSIGAATTAGGTFSRHSSQGFAYSGVDFASPPLPATKSMPRISNAANTGGRTRVKSSYYAPGVYPRVSNATPAPPSAMKKAPAMFFDEPEEDDLRSLERSESRQDRDTHALTSALDLASPQPTLYPDDSLSMAGGDFTRQISQSKSNVRNYIKPVPAMRHRIDTPPDDSAELGNLMLVDFGSGIVPLKSGTGEKKLDAPMARKRLEDRPPRVPSPPALPSLTQMGLKHANPEAYDDYRSPTYSIYGLYHEADRKSKATSFGY